LDLIEKNNIKLEPESIKEKNEIVSNNFHINDIEIYNKIFFALAKQGNTKKIFQLFEKIRKDNTENSVNLQLNLSSYAAALQSLGNNLYNSPQLDFNSIRSDIERTVYNIKKKNVFKFLIKLA
jgi:pentatricopeptide repeat protein